MKHVIQIHRPELTSEEREKRMASIKRAAKKLVVQTYIKERKQKHEHNHN